LRVMTTGTLIFLSARTALMLSCQRMVEDALVKEDQGIHCLVLGGGSDVCMSGEVGQERFDLGFG